MTRTLIAAFFSLCASGALAGPPLLSQLQPGERLRVAYHSRGCFHDRKYDIDFQRGSSVTARSAGHTVTLSASEVAGLDKLFQFIAPSLAAAAPHRTTSASASFAVPKRFPASITLMVHARLTR